MASYGICRIEAYKAVANKSYDTNGNVKSVCNDTAAGALAECLRELEKYSNPNYDSSIKNISLIEPKCHANEYIDWLKKYRKENNVKGNLKLNSEDRKRLSTVMVEAYIGATPAWLAKKPEDEQIAFLKQGFEFLKQEFPYMEWVAAEIHCDEPAHQLFTEDGRPVLNEDGEEVWTGGNHLQVCAVPVHQREDGTKVISWGAIQGGYNKDFYIDLQDRWHEYLQQAGYTDLQRGKSAIETQARHVRPAEWRKLSEELQHKRGQIKVAEEILDELKPAVELAQKAKDVQVTKTLTGAVKLSQGDYKALVAAAETGAMALDANTGLCEEVDNLKEQLQEALKTKEHDELATRTAMATLEKQLANERAANKKMRKKVEEYDLLVDYYRGNGCQWQQPDGSWKSLLYAMIEKDMGLLNIPANPGKINEIVSKAAEQLQQKQKERSR